MTTIDSTTQSLSVVHPRRITPWLTAAPVAVLLAYADGFWLTSLQGAVGAIERAQTPFANWWRTSTLMVPVFLIAVLGALALARRWYGPSLRGTKAVLGTVLLVTAAATLVGVANLVANAAYDYHLQANLIEVAQNMRAGGSATTAMNMDASTMASMAGMGDVPSQLHATLMVHARGVGYATPLILVTNLVLVAWMTAMRGADWGPRRRPADGTDAVSAT
jgi:hypothetical protein